MRVHPTDTPSIKNARIKVRNIDIIDNLAQINHILTDKTGTLTKHLFSMISCYIGGQVFGEVSDSRKWVRGFSEEVV